jgi:hypothetical protein
MGRRPVTTPPVEQSLALGTWNRGSWLPGIRRCHRTTDLQPCLVCASATGERVGKKRTHGFLHGVMRHARPAECQC